MVGEFPELQGIMGTYYALADGEPHEVATAIREHYLPRSAGDALPASALGITLAIADKLDTLAGIFAIGGKPSGAKDPFGLRRAGLGVQRILIEKGLDLDLPAHIARALGAVRADIERLGTRAAPPPAGAADPAALAGEIYDFLMERLRAYYLEGGAAASAARPAVTAEMFDAVLAARPASPLDFDARLKALSMFLALPEAGSLTAANKRISNILRKANTTPGARGRRASAARGRRGAPLRCHARAARCGVGRHRAARVRRRPGPARAAAARGRCVLRPGDGHGRGPGAARQSLEPARPAAGSVRRGRGPVATAGLSERAAAAEPSRRGPLLQLAGSLFFTGFLFLWTFLYAIFFVLACLMLPFPRRFALARAYAVSVLAVLRWSCGLTYRIEGEPLPPGCHIALWKHSSSWETIAMMVVFPRQVWVLKRELLWVPAVGLGLRQLHAIAIDRQRRTLRRRAGARAGQGAPRGR